MRLRESGRTPSTAFPKSRMLPAVGRMRPRSIPILVFFPEPVGPQQAEHTGIRNLQGQVVHGRNGAVAFGEALRLDSPPFSSHRLARGEQAFHFLNKAGHLAQDVFDGGAVKPALVKVGVQLAGQAKLIP